MAQKIHPRGEISVQCFHPQAGHLSKNGYVWVTQWPSSSELKIKFDPSLDRSWCEFFKIIVQEIHPRGVIWIPSISPHAGRLSEKMTT